METNNMEKSKQNYVDGFLLVVPKDKVEEYKKMAEISKKLWLKHGALGYKECMGEDLNPKAPEGVPSEMKPPRSFVEAAGAKADETVWFSFIVFESRKHRDEVNAKVMKDMGEEMSGQSGEMPFDMGRVFYGGFSVEVGD